MGLDTQGALVFGQLPSSLSYGQASWPVRKIPLRRTALKIAYHPDMRIYVVVTSWIAAEYRAGPAPGLFPPLAFSRLWPFPA